MGLENDEPLSPAGRLFVQPATHQIINGVLGLEHPLGYDTLRTVISDSLMIKHPRFSSLLVTDDQGREYWRKIELDIERHVIVRSDPVGEGENNEEVVNAYLADLTVSCPLHTDKPLWEVHLLSAHKCVVMRFHHALGDGISLMSLMLTLCRKLDDPEQMPTIQPLTSSTRKPRKLGTMEKILNVLKVIWFSLVYVFGFMVRGVWVKDRKTVVRGGEGVELWPRKLVTARFSVQDMKTVKSVVPNATINDVLFGIISFGLSKYLDHRSPDSLQEGLQLTGVSLVNLRPSPGLQDMKELMKKNAGTGWGNKIGVMLLPVYYHKNKSNPLEYVKRAKMMMDRKKMSLEALLSHQIGYFVMKFFGAKAITMHMVSYAGKADMQILVAKDLIPDPEKLAKCFEDALLEMKEYAIDTKVMRKSG